MDRKKYNRQVRYRLTKIGTNYDEFLLAGKWEDIDPDEVWARAVRENEDGVVRCSNCRRELIRWDTPGYYDEFRYHKYSDECACIDHNIPLGPGSHTYDNVQLLCRRCNMRKGRREKWTVARWEREHFREKMANFSQAKRQEFEALIKKEGI